MKIDFSRSQRIAAGRSAVWALVIDPVHVARLMPAATSVVADGNRWAWRLQTYRVLGFQVTPEFDVEISPEPEVRVTFRPAGRTAAEGIHAAGQFELTERGSSHTDLEFDLDLRLDLGIPSLLTGTVRSVIVRELQRGTREFFRNVEREVRR